MVSLAKLSKVTEEGVEFQSPHDGSIMLLTPEKSMEIQNAIGELFFIVDLYNNKNNQFYISEKIRSRYYDAA